MQVFKVYPAGGFSSNSFIITKDNKTAVVVDPSLRCVEKLAELGLNCEAVLLTHGHFDHVGGCGELYEKGAAICCGERERELIFSPEYISLFGGVYVPRFEISRTLADGEEIELRGLKFKCIFTPGHTAGSVTYECDGALFTGDTLFFESVGRCDLPTGSSAELVRSIKTLYALEGDYKIYCGHESDTTLAHERVCNPYVQE